MSTNYERGQAILFDGVPAVILEVGPYEGQLTIAQHPGMKSYIGTQHSKLAHLDEAVAFPHQAERVAEIRAYYDMSPERWHIRRDGRSVTYAGSAADVLAWFHRHHSFSASHAVRYEGYTITGRDGKPMEV